LPYSTSISLSFHALNPGACFALLWIQVMLGIFFQNRPVLSQLKTCLGSYFPSLIIFFNSAGNMAAVYSSAEAASPTTLMFLRLNLSPKLCNHPLLAVKGLVSSSIPSFFWKSSYRLKAFCRNILLSSGTLFQFISSNQKFKAFSTFMNTLSHATAVTFAVCGPTEKLAQIFLCSSSLHEWNIGSCHTTWQSLHTIFFLFQSYPEFSLSH